MSSSRVSPLLCCLVAVLAAVTGCGPRVTSWSPTKAAAPVMSEAAERDKLIRELGLMPDQIELGGTTGMGREPGRAWVIHFGPEGHRASGMLHTYRSRVWSWMGRMRVKGVPEWREGRMRTDDAPRVAMALCRRFGLYDPQWGTPCRVSPPTMRRLIQRDGSGPTVISVEVTVLSADRYIPDKVTFEFDPATAACTTIDARGPVIAHGKVVYEEDASGQIVDRRRHRQ